MTEGTTVGMETSLMKATVVSRIHSYVSWLLLLLKVIRGKVLIHVYE